MIAYPLRPLPPCLSLIAAALLAALLAAPIVAAAPAPPAVLDVRTDPGTQRLDLSFAAGAVDVQAISDGVRLRGVRGAATVRLAPDAAGELDWPVVYVNVVVDPGRRVTGVTVRRASAVALPALDGWLAERRATAAVPGGAGPPLALARVVGEGWMRGRRVVALELVPLRIAGQHVELVRELQIELRSEPDPAPAGLRSERAVPWGWKAERGLRAVSVDLRARPAAAALRQPAGGASGSAEPFSPTFRPSLDGSPVEYVVITSEALAPAFQRLADWKTQKGVQAVVRTVEWIEQTYPNGVDRAEQIRFFVRDAYLHWGTLWLLLGGDTDIVPARFALSTLGNPVELIPTDLYYSALDGNWNADADDRFGEAPAGPDAGDLADLLPEVFVGRAPASTLASADVFVDKVLTYESAPPVDERYPGSILLLGEQLTPILDGAELCEETLQVVPVAPYIQKVRMYENYPQYPGALPENEEAVLDSLSAGYGVVLHVGHGFRNSMSVGDGTLNNAEIDQLTNGDRQSLVFAINCSSAAIDFNAIGERFLKNPNGGAAAYVGSSRLTTVGPAQDFQNEFFTRIYTDTLTAAGQALVLSKLPFVGAAQAADNGFRWMTFAMLLLGDPEMPVWHRTPEETFVNFPPGFELGSSIFSAVVNVLADPVEGARVALRKPGEFLAIGTTNSIGQAYISFNPYTSGPATITVTKPGYTPFQGSFDVIATSAPFVHADGVAVDDDGAGQSNGNGDQRADAGETVEVTLTLRNAGGGSATNVWAQINSSDAGPFMTIVEPVVTYGALAPGTTASGTGSFVVTLAPDAPEAFEPVFDVVIGSDNQTWNDVFVLPVYGRQLEHYGHRLDDPLPGGNGNGVPEPGETIEYTVTLRNVGVGEAVGVNGTLAVLNAATMQPDPEATVLDGSAQFGDLAPGALQEGDSFSFSLTPAAVIEQLLLELTWSDQHGVLAVEHDDLEPPALVTGLQAFGSQSTITLRWTPPADTDCKGYDIFRTENPFGEFERINAFTADGSSVYEDAGLPPLMRYYYYVAARDSSYNASVPSAIISGSTNPPLKSGWPIETGQESSSAVVIDDVDGDGNLEAVTGADMIYAWRADGTELRDGDHDPQTSGPFSLDGADPNFGYQASPALADLDGDGTIEIIGLAWRAAQVYVWEANGDAAPGWPQPIGGDFNWASPAVDDLDGDGDQEVVAVSGQEGIVYAWHHDGTELFDGDADPATNGVLFDTPTSFLYASPAVGQIAGDLDCEIVVATNHSDGMVYLLDLTGQPLPGWPYFAGGQVTASPTLVDLDGDGFCEVVFAAEDDSVYVLRGDATSYPGWPQSAITNSVTGHTGSVTIAELSGEGAPELVYAANDGRMHVWQADGTPLAGWEEVLFAQNDLPADATQCTPTVADIDDDGRVEVVLGAEDGLVYGWNDDGSEADGFPIAITGEIRGAVSLWDFDLDNFMELSLISNDRNVYVWELPGQFRGDRVEWPFFRHDVRNTGRYDAALTSIGVADPAAGAPRGGAAARLLPSVPNPFNPATTVRFVVPGEAGGARPVRLAIYDVAGRQVRELVHGPVATGEVAVRWDGRDHGGRHLASGAYFVRLEVAGRVLSGKLVMLK